MFILTFASLDFCVQHKVRPQIMIKIHLIPRLKFAFVCGTIAESPGFNSMDQITYC